jgi:hypothetical protein
MFKWLIAFALAMASAGIAQDIISAKAGLVYFVQGSVSIERQRLPIGAVTRRVDQGEALFSETGRAEVLLNPGTVLRIGDLTRIRMDSVELTNARISIEAGSAVVTVRQPPNIDRVEIRIGGAVVLLKGDGLYRFDADSLGVDAPRLRVFSGQAEVHREGDVLSRKGSLKEIVKGGQAVRLQDLQVTRFEGGDADALQRWVETRDTPPEFRTIPPMECWSGPANTAELKVWMSKCLGR